MNVGDRVVVDAAATGDGEHHHGRIIDIYDFARASFIEVMFDHLTLDGRSGITLSNPGLLRMEVTA